MCVIRKRVYNADIVQRMKLNKSNLTETLRKLNKRKIRWIVLEIDKRDICVYAIAKIQDIPILKILYCLN